MSIKIDINSLSEEEKDLIINKLQFQKKENFYGNFQADPIIIRPFNISKNSIDLPLAWAMKNIPIAKNKRKTRNEFSEMSTDFVGTLKPLQKDIQKEVITLLNKKASCLLSIYTGGGKTITSIYIACKIKLPTLIIIHRLILINQWVDSIKKVCKNPKIQILSAKSKLDKNCDFYIINAINVSKKEDNFFDNIGTLITDEIHAIATEKLAQSFYYIHPRYCIGLSATPYRSDGMDELIYAYFGKTQVHRKLNRKHIVFKVKTGFEPTIEYGRNGKIDWNVILESQTNDIPRNELIINIIKLFGTRNFLVLSKRVSQVEYLVKRLKEENVSVTSLVGVKKYFDYDSRVLVATVQKAGVGFDHAKLDSLIIASDVEEYFIQYLGRVFRTDTGVPYIFDLVDNFKILLNHYYTRRKIYVEHGGIVQDFKLKNILKLQDVNESNFKNIFQDHL